MKFESFFYNCSKEYVNTIDSDLFNSIADIISNLPKRNTQMEINNDLLIEFTSKGWSYDSAPKEFKSRIQNNRSLCLTSSNLCSNWHADFARQFNISNVQIEVQFGKVELMFKDFCGFKIAYYERRISLGIEIVMCEPYKYFYHRKKAISGMAYFDIAQQTLPVIGLDCPIWLLGIME